jgi:hypothetical protein
MRETARFGKTPDIGDHAHAGGFERGDEILDRAGRMTDSENRHRVVK